MQFNMRQAFRMAKWARSPPGEKQVKLFFIVVLICLALFGVERLFGWPDWLTMEGTPSGKINK